MADTKKFGTDVQLAEQKTSDFSPQSLAEGRSFVDGKSGPAFLESLREIVRGMDITANQFVTSANERVLTDEGQQGMHGKQGVGSTTERHQGQVAAAIYANCAQLDNRQLDEIIEWVCLYKK